MVKEWNTTSRHFQSKILNNEIGMVRYIFQILILIRIRYRQKKKKWKGLETKPFLSYWVTEFYKRSALQNTAAINFILQPSISNSRLLLIRGINFLSTKTVDTKIHFVSLHNSLLIPAIYYVSHSYNNIRNWKCSQIIKKIVSHCDWQMLKVKTNFI